MNTEQILKVLKAERDCIKNAKDYCYEDCDEHCPYYVSEEEKLEVYDHLIKVCEMDAIIVADISEEDKRVIIKTLAKAGYGIAPELEEKYLKGDTE